jgi:hypothetical protein
MNNNKELKKAIDSIQPGSCFGHYENSARECKSCFVVEQCSKNTAGKKLAAESEVPTKVKKKTTTSVKKKYVKRKEDIKSAEEKSKLAEVKVSKEESPKESKAPKEPIAFKDEVPKAPKDEASKAPKDAISVVDGICFEEGVNAEKTGAALVDLLVSGVSKSIPISGYFSNSKSVFYLFDGKEMVITYMKANGKLQISKNGERKVYSLQSEADANSLKKAMLVGYGN